MPETFRITTRHAISERRLQERNRFHFAPHNRRLWERARLAITPMQGTPPNNIITWRGRFRPGRDVCRGVNNRRNYRSAREVALTFST